MGHRSATSLSIRSFRVTPPEGTQLFTGSAKAQTFQESHLIGGGEQIYAPRITQGEDWLAEQMDPVRERANREER